MTWPEETFVRLAKTTRESLGITQSDMATSLSHLGIPFRQQTVAKIERGARPVRLNEFFAICDVLGLKPAHAAAFASEKDNADLIEVARLKSREVRLSQQIHSIEAERLGVLADIAALSPAVSA